MYGWYIIGGRGGGIRTSSYFSHKNSSSFWKILHPYSVLVLNILHLASLAHGDYLDCARLHRPSDDQWRPGTAQTSKLTPQPLVIYCERRGSRR